MGLATKKGQAECNLTEARVEAEEIKSETDLLKHDVDRLLMITESLWTFIKKQHGYTDDDLTKAIGATDLRNSGASKDAREKCPSCGRMVSPHRQICLYCGNPVPQSLFEA